MHYIILFSKCGQPILKFYRKTSLLAVSVAKVVLIMRCLDRFSIIPLLLVKCSMHPPILLQILILRESWKLSFLPLVHTLDKVPEVVQRLLVRDMKEPVPSVVLFFPPSDLSSKSKSSKSTKMDEALAAWAKSLNAKTEATLEKVKRKRENEVSSPLRELSTIEDCMEVLEGMEDVDDIAYLKALEKFTSSDWRRMFMKMSESRKKLWLNSLK